MKRNFKHKLYLGFRGLLMPMPPSLSDKGAKRGQKGAKTSADSLSVDERRVHHYVVMKMATVKDPITAELIATELHMPRDRVHQTIDKLENLKIFLYWGDGKGINWAYPLSLENTGFKMVASSGEQFFAA